MASDGVKQVVGLFMVLLVVALVVGGGFLAYKYIWPWINNLFFYKDTGIQPNPNEGGNVLVDSGVYERCYEQYSDCRVCMIYWASDEKGTPLSPLSIKSGEEVYAFVRGTEDCKGKVAFFVVVEDNYFGKSGDIATKAPNKQKLFSDEKSPVAYHNVNLNNDNWWKSDYYYFYVFNTDKVEQYFPVSGYTDLSKVIYKGNNPEIVGGGISISAKNIEVTK